jgi:hypothetical protein
MENVKFKFRDKLYRREKTIENIDFRKKEQKYDLRKFYFNCWFILVFHLEANVCRENFQTFFSFIFKNRV